MRTLKVALLSESSADEAAIRILVEGILGRKTETIAPKLRTRGWPSVLNIIPSVLKHLHYQTDAEAFVIATDSNTTPVHRSAHEQIENTEVDCRLCQLRKVMAQAKSSLRPISGRLPIKSAIGVATPAIEAWYRCGIDPHVTEAAWLQALESNSFSYTTQSLKQAVYGTNRIPLELETRRAMEEAHRLVHNLYLLEALFPNGFGALARDVRGWLTTG